MTAIKRDISEEAGSVKQTYTSQGYQHRKIEYRGKNYILKSDGKFYILTTRPSSQPATRSDK